MTGQFVVNTACGSPKQHWEHVNNAFEYQCNPLLLGHFVAVQKLDISATGDDLTLNINEIEIFHQGETRTKTMDNLQQQLS